MHLINKTPLHSTDGRLVWVVSGRNGENPIRAEGATSAEAWLAAVEDARLMGMLRGQRSETTTPALFPSTLDLINASKTAMTMPSGLPNRDRDGPTGNGRKTPSVHMLLASLVTCGYDPRLSRRRSTGSRCRDQDEFARLLVLKRIKI
jgi:hypothetical protein